MTFCKIIFQYNIFKYVYTYMHVNKEEKDVPYIHSSYFPWLSIIYYELLNKHYSSTRFTYIYMIFFFFLNL